MFCFSEIVLFQFCFSVFTLGMGGADNFVHVIYREKIPRYRVYRGTCFVISLV